MTAPLCHTCQRPDPTSGYICAHCARRTSRLLAAAADLVDETNTTIARQVRYSANGRGDTAGLPVDLGASTATAQAANDITTWARHIIETRGLPATHHPVPYGPACGLGDCRHQSCHATRHRPHRVAEAARVILGNTEWLRHCREAIEAFDQLHAAAKTILRIVDCPPPLWYAGPCWEPIADQYGKTGKLCDAELYARAGADHVRCPACGHQSEVAARRDWLLHEAEDVLAHANLAAQALTALDRPVTASMVRGWAHRGRLTAHGNDQRGRPLYRVGDVLDLAWETAQRRDKEAAA